MLDIHATPGRVQYRMARKLTELAKLLDVDPRTVKNWSRQGLIKVIKVGREFRIPADEFDRIMEGEFLNDTKGNGA